MKKSRVAEFIRNPKKALFTLTLPLLVGMFVHALYNIIDTAFVGRLGADSIAALTFSFPLYFILMAFSNGIGTGMASRISRFLGEKNKPAAENTALHGIILSIAVAIIVFILGLIFLEPIMALFGAEGNVLQLSISYMSIILCGVFVMFPGYIFNSIFSAQGDTKTPMKALVFSLVLNIILDPIFIFVFGMGVPGAALATVISILFSLGVYLYYLKKKSYLKLHPKHFKLDMRINWEIFKVGAPATLTIILMSIAYMFFNKFVALFGTNYIAAYGIVSRLDSLAVLPMIALSTAMMTLAGMFFGAKKYEILKKTSWYAVKIGLWFTSIMALIFFMFPNMFMSIFTTDPILIQIGTDFLRVMVFILPVMAVGMILSRTMQGMGLGMPALIFTVVRLIVLSVPLAYIFIYVLGFGFLSVPLAGIIGAIISDGITVIWYNAKIKVLEQ